MIALPYQLPLAQYLHILELAKDLDATIFEQVSIESVEEGIKRQLESSLPASHTGDGLRTYQDLKAEEQAIGRILSTIDGEIQPVASKLSPGFANSLKQEYEEKQNTVQKALRLSDELDKAYRQIREQEKEALEKRKDKLLEAHKLGIGLSSVADLAEEINQLEDAEEEIRKFQERSAQEWAVLAEQQMDEKRAEAFWGKALEHDNSPPMCDRRDRHMAALHALKEGIGDYEGSLKEARELFDRATEAPPESSYNSENDLRQALGKCEYVIEALVNYPYPSSTRHEAQRLRSQISSHNDFVWKSRAISCIALAELDLASSNLDQAAEYMAHARDAVSHIWDDDLQSSLTKTMQGVQQKIEDKARQGLDHVIMKWSQQAQAYLDGKDAVAALNCLYAAEALSTNETGNQSSQELESLQSKALAALSQDVTADARSLAERGNQFLSQQDSQSAFRWLEAALQLDAEAILSDSDFTELTDKYFEFQSKGQRSKSLLFQAEFRLVQDPRNPDNMVAAEALLREASELLEEIGETGRLPEVDETRLELRRIHREALVEELDVLLERLEDNWETEEAAKPQKMETLWVLKDLTQVLAKFDKAGFAVENVKPHLEKVFEYYDQLRSDDELRSNPNNIEGYSLSYMLLRKASKLESRENTL